jgi:alpha-L-fucosidase
MILGIHIQPNIFLHRGLSTTESTSPSRSTRLLETTMSFTSGQTVQIPQGRYFSVQRFASSENGLAPGFINATYSDGSTSSSPVLVPAWYNWPYPSGGDIILPYSLINMTINYNRSTFYETINWIDSTKELVSLALPNVTAGSNGGPGGAAIQTRLHLFSVSVLPATGTAIDLEVQ